MVFYVIIRGPAAVGKTTIGKGLAEQLNGKHISVDKVLKENGLDYIPGEKWVPEHKCLKFNAIVLPRVKERLKEGKIVVFDGNFYHKSQIENLIDNLDFQHFVFTLKAELNDCISRDKKREGELGEQAVKDVFKLVSAFDYGTIIDTKGKSHEQEHCQL